MSPRFIGPFKILARVGNVAYKLELPEELSKIYDTFHVSQLRRCLADDTRFVAMNEIELDKKLSYVEEPVEIVEEQLRRVLNKTVRTYKIQWKHSRGTEYTWETENDVLVYYPSLHMAWITRTRSVFSRGDCNDPII